MEILKSEILKPCKCQYGDFELKPDDGWEVSHSFIDYESKLLIVSVSIIDKSKWIDDGFHGRLIPTKSYKIDLQSLKILNYSEWKKYFNYNKIEIISDDKKYKLVTQRLYDQERDSDGIDEQLYDLTTNTLISSGKSVAFHQQKRENLLESLYRSIKEREAQKSLLEAKPSLEQFYLKRLEELMDNDEILSYYDKSNVFRLDYVDKKFVLSRGVLLNSDLKEWNSVKFELFKNFDNLDEFWNDFITTEKWFLVFSYPGYLRNSSKALVLAKHMISFFNDLRRTHDFTYAEHDKINSWSNLVWSEEYRITEIKQWCPSCYKEVHYRARYPKYICFECASKNKFDVYGNLLEFSNLGVSGGFKITYMDIHGHTIREDDTQEYCECRIDNKLFFAREAKLGGIVIQLK